MPDEKKPVKPENLVPSRRINMTNQNVRSTPVTFGLSCTVIRHVIQTCVISVSRCRLLISPVLTFF